MGRILNKWFPDLHHIFLWLNRALRNFFCTKQESKYICTGRTKSTFNKYGIYKIYSYATTLSGIITRKSFSLTKCFKDIPIHGWYRLGIFEQKNLRVFDFWVFFTHFSILTFFSFTKQTNKRCDMCNVYGSGSIFASFTFTSKPRSFLDIIFN